MSATPNANSQSVSFDSSKAVSAQQQIDASLYTDWTTAPVGRVVKDRLAGKVALITGASAGIGAVTARRLAAEGAKVVLFARREEKLVELVSAIKKSGGDAVYFVGDASSENDNKKAVDVAVKQFGGLHITFNNAGIARGLGQKPWETAVDAFNEVMASNVNGIFFAVKAQAPVISQSGGGVIINNASTSAFMPGRSGSTIYPASKAWVVSYTQHAAAELAKIGVRINTISPGPTLSDVLGADNKQVLAEFGKCTAIGRALKPEEIAGTVAFLAADEAMAITGNDLVIDGGFKIAQDPSH